MTELGNKMTRMTAREYFSYPTKTDLKIIDAKIARDVEGNGNWYTDEIRLIEDLSDDDDV